MPICIVKADYGPDSREEAQSCSSKTCSSTSHIFLSSNGISAVFEVREEITSNEQYCRPRCHGLHSWCFVLQLQRDAAAVQAAPTLLNTACSERLRYKSRCDGHTQLRRGVFRGLEELFMAPAVTSTEKPRIQTHHLDGSRLRYLGKGQASSPRAG